MKDAIQQWFAQAKDELSMAEVLFASSHYRGACSHAQQSLEKALKGALLHVGWELERTQSLRKLVAIGKRYGIEARLSEDDMDFIDSVYRGRYPAEEGLLPTGAPTCEEAERIIQAVSQSLPQICQIT